MTSDNTRDRGENDDRAGTTTIDSDADGVRDPDGAAGHERSGAVGDRSGRPGSGGGYGEAESESEETASRLTGDSASSRPAEPFDADGQPFDEDP